jgi:hypothetical protein
MAAVDRLMAAGYPQKAAALRAHAITRAQGGCYAGAPWNEDLDAVLAALEDRDATTL